METVFTLLIKQIWENYYFRGIIITGMEQKFKKQGDLGLFVEHLPVKKVK